MEKQLKWGIAGVGMIAHDFLTAMATLPSEQHKVIAIAGKDLDRVRRLATLHNIGTAYEGYEAIASDNDIGTFIENSFNISYCLLFYINLFVIAVIEEVVSEGISFFLLDVFFPIFITLALYFINITVLL